MRNSIFLVSLFTSFNIFGQMPSSPKLVVGIVVDQMCYEYLYRYEQKFCENGFRTFLEKGTNCRNTLYNYVPTYTGPGHASIYTGAVPADHGIVGNEWFDRESGLIINCVDDNGVQPIGTNGDDGKCSPQNLKTYTISDQLKLTYPDAKVISMSIKDRGAILPGGHLSDGSYWYDYSSGRFITSSFFESQLPDWVTKFNNEGQVDRYMTQTWNTILDISAYAESGPDDSPYEVLLPGKTTPTFPYDLKAMSANGSKYQLFTTTPFANTLLTELAIRSIDPEQLGKDSQTDLLCISYSTPDIAGHAFGPYSVELEDIYIRLDLELGRLIKTLEEKVGKDQFVVFLTADHAVVPVPKYLTDKKMPGGYLYVNEFLTELESNVIKKFGADLILAEENQNIYLDHTQLDSLKLKRSDVADFISEEIGKWKGVKRSYTFEEIEFPGSDGGWMDMIRKGYHPAESGDVIFILEPGYLLKSTETASSHKGTSHGSAFNYDTHVPLLWYGKGIPVMQVIRSIDIIDIAATLTHIFYLQRSGAMTGNPILELFESR